MLQRTTKKATIIYNKISQKVWECFAAYGDEMYMFIVIHSSKIEFPVPFNELIHFRL